MAGYIGNKAVGLNVTTGDILGDVGVGGVVTANAGVVVDEMTLDADTLTATDTFTVDAEGIITLDSNFGDGAIIRLADGGTQFGDLFEVAGDFLIASAQVDKDIIFKGNDGGSIITALTLDMSAAGGATFNSGIFGANIRVSDNIDIRADDGELYFTNAANNRYWLIARDASNNLKIIRYSGSAVTTDVMIDANGNLLVGKTATGIGTAGIQAESTGQLNVTQSGNTVIRANRLANDGTVIGILQANTEEGTISVSGGTVSYNAFSGSHWSRLTDNSEPTILKGTLIETIDEMCDWYQAQFTVLATTKVNEEGDTVEDVAAYTLKESIALPDGASVGDTISHISNDVTYSATIVKENDNKHPKCKISNTADSVRIYGVFAAWDNDEDTVNDMYVTAVGTHVVRVHGGQTVSAGDLLVSNGDGTAKVQDDDIIRSKTLGKVLTNIKQETYADNSYTVPCALYCG